MTLPQNFFHLQPRKGYGKTLQIAIAVQHAMAHDPNVNVFLATHDRETGRVRLDRVVDVLLPRPLAEPSDDKGDA